MLKTFRLVPLAPLCVLSAVLFAGCGGGSGSGPSTGSGTGTLQVSLVDAPDPSISSLEITIDRVQAHIVDPDNADENAESQWKTINTEPITVDLLDLQRQSLNLGSTTLPTGRYTQIRLFPTDARVTDADGTHDVTIPSGQQTGIKLNVGYTISPNEVTELLLDFNVSKSLIKTGNGRYRLQPVIPVVVRVLSGTITGSVSDSNGSVNMAEIKATYTAGDQYPLGTEVNSALSGEDGVFKMWALLPGTYTLTVTTPAGGTATLENVVVTANGNTEAGVITANVPTP